MVFHPFRIDIIIFMTEFDHYIGTMKRIRNHFLFSLIFVQTLVSAEDKDWHRFRGPQGSGVSSSNSIPLKWSSTENIFWQVNLPGEGASSPVIWKDHIYLTAFTRSGNSTQDLNRMVLCLDRESTDG